MDGHTNGIKLLKASGVTEPHPVFIRVGTSGGLGLQPGTVVISSGCVNGLLDDHYTIHSLGKVIRRPCVLDASLAQALFECKGSLEAVKGLTMSTDDFYEGQGRIDGAICQHDIDDKMAWLKEIYKHGVRNIEMEADALAAFTHHLHIRCAIVCCAILNRLEGDQVTSTPAQVVSSKCGSLTELVQEKLAAAVTTPVSPSTESYFYLHHSLPHVQQTKPTQPQKARASLGGASAATAAVTVASESAEGGSNSGGVSKPTGKKKRKNRKGSS